MSIFTRDPLQIIPFKTYGTKSHLYIKGRALEDEKINLEANVRMIVTLALNK